jgi:hypothetical protein
VVTTGVTDQDFYGAPLLAAAVRNTKVLFAGEQGLSPWTGWSYSIGTGGVLTNTSTTAWDARSNLSDAALDPAGTTVYTASGAPYHVESFPMADLIQAGPALETGPYPAQCLGA